MSITRNGRITTVITPAASFDLTTLLNVKSDLTINDVDPTIDIYLSRIITQVSGLISAECNRVFALQTYKDNFRPGRDNALGPCMNVLDYLAVANIPLVSVASVVEDGTALVVDTDYEIDLATGRLYRLDANNNRVHWNGKQIIVQYAAGWTLPSANNPAGPNQLLVDAPELEDAVIELVKGRYLAKDRDPYLKVDQVDGVGSQTFWFPDTPVGAFPAAIDDILDSYRLTVMA
jgi:hypothetical protein